MNVSAEWVAVGISVLVAFLSGFQIWQNTNIKLAVSKVETTMESRLGDVREWAREVFVSKTDQMHLLEVVSKDVGKKKIG